MSNLAGDDDYITVTPITAGGKPVTLKVRPLWKRLLRSPYVFAKHFVIAYAGGATLRQSLFAGRALAWLTVRYCAEPISFEIELDDLP